MKNFTITHELYNAVMVCLSDPSISNFLNTTDPMAHQQLLAAATRAEDAGVVEKVDAGVQRQRKEYVVSVRQKDSDIYFPVRRLKTPEDARRELGTIMSKPSYLNLEFDDIKIEEHDIKPMLVLRNENPKPVV